MNRELITTGFSGMNLLLAFAAGAAIGTIAALLLAPAPGTETRRRVRETAREAAQKPRDLVRRVEGAVHHAREAADVEVSEALAEAR